MRVLVMAKKRSPVTVVLEPSGMQFVLQPEDYFEFEWEDSPESMLGFIDHKPDRITIGQGSGRIGMWNSSGEEMPIIG